MKINSNAANVLGLFATYGFRKASMSDIAKAADLSRQSIYNQFGSKEAVMEWAVTDFMNEITDAAIKQLETGDGRSTEVLARAFQSWTGDHVPLLSGTPHGAEILEKATESIAKASRDYEGEFLGAVAAFIDKNKMLPTGKEANEASYVLHLASKGLLLKSETSEAYAVGMGRVIGVLFG